MNLSTIKNNKLFRGLSPLELLVYLLLLFFATLLAFSWYRAINILYILTIISFVKIIWTKNVRTSYSKRSIIFVIFLLAYYALSAISLLWTENIDAGWVCLAKKRGLLLFPLIFLLSDYSFLSSIRVRAILHAFVFGLNIRFLYRLTLSLNNIFETNGTISDLISPSFDCMHHTFLSMFTVLGLCFIFIEILNNTKNNSFVYKIYEYTSIIFLSLYTFFVQSRMGLITIYLLIVIMAFVLFFKRKKIQCKYFAFSSVITCALLIGLLSVLPQKTTRLSNTTQEISEGDYSDIRFEIWNNSIITIKDNIPWGCGIGDQINELERHYIYLPPDAELRKHLFHSHNQFLSTVLTTGIMGLAFLIILLVGPLLRIRKQNNLYYPYLIPLIAITILNSMIDSIWDWTEGTLFFGFFYCLFLLPTCSQDYQKDSIFTI